jgi:hypothetical protein
LNGNKMKRHQQKVFAVCLMALVATDGWAGENLKLTSTFRNIPERGQVASAQVQAGGWNVSFIVPAGWRLGQNGDKVVLQSQDFSARIELAVNQPAPEKGAQPDAAASARSRVVKEFGWTTPLGPGLAVESEQATPDNLRLFTQQITIPQPDGTATLTLVSSPDKYAQHQKALRSLAASLRAQ